MCLSVFCEENDCTASLFLCNHNHSFLFIVFFHISSIFLPLFYLVDQSNCLVSYLLWFVRQGYWHLLVHQDGKIEKSQIIYKWTGWRASGSDGWPHWASLLLFSFQSIWYECAFTHIYIYIYISPLLSGLCWLFTFIDYLTHNWWSFLLTLR